MLGVAIVSMTIFGARLTRRPRDEILAVEEFDVDADPNDPWAAWKPRPFQDMDRQRPRLWPLGAALTGLILVGAGVAGARETLWSETAAEPTDPTPRPYLVEVEVAAAATAKPATPTPLNMVTPPPTQAPVASTAATAAPKPSTAATPAPSAATGAGPTLTATGSCTGGTISMNYSATGAGAELKWLTVYLDGAMAKGGPVSGSSTSGTFTKQGAGTGDHDLEVAVEDQAGKTARKQLQVRCA